MTAPAEELLWEAHELGQAMQSLGRACRIGSTMADVPQPPAALSDRPDEVVDRWVTRAAARLHLEAEAADCRYDEVDAFLRHAGPALLKQPQHRYLALLPGGRFLGRDRRIHHVPLKHARPWLRHAVEGPVEAECRDTLRRAGVAESRLPTAVPALVEARVGHRRVGHGWLLHLPPGAPFGQQLARHGVPLRLALLLALQIVLTTLTVVSWWIIGRAALQGHVDIAWLVIWALLLPTMVPFLLSSTWLQGNISRRIGALLKARLLYGALRLDPDEIRTMGSGQLLGRVVESQNVETLALSGGFLSLTAAVELMAAGWVMFQGAGRGWQVLLLAGWTGLTVAMAWRYQRRRRQWTSSRLDLTQDLVESMVGQRTRLAQQAQERWHDGEDARLERYTLDSQAMDRSTVGLLAFVPRGLLWLGLAGLAPGFVTGLASRTSLAIGLGGLLLAFRALQGFAQGLSTLLDAAIAWTHVAPLFEAAARPPETGVPDIAIARDVALLDAEVKSMAIMAEMVAVPNLRTPSLLEAHDVSFRYPARHQAILRGLRVRVERGDRIRVEGPSGGGKSTLAALLCGVRRAEAGLLTLDGLDPQTIGEAGWRQSVVMAPQFHDNHVIGATFLFNLLMGRRWPPTAQDVQQAEAVCRGLGLGPLVDRMPAGLLQMVGESGWQLSHGEKSRLFVARTLLQGADLIILDESFAALDPPTMKVSLQYVLDHAPALIVIAHP